LDLNARKLGFAIDQVGGACNGEEVRWTEWLLYTIDSLYGIHRDPLDNKWNLERVYYKWTLDDGVWRYISY
jgi:hypothetical protein